MSSLNSEQENAIKTHLKLSSWKDDEIEVFMKNFLKIFTQEIENLEDFKKILSEEKILARKKKTILETFLIGSIFSGNLHLFSDNEIFKKFAEEFRNNPEKIAFQKEVFEMFFREHPDELKNAPDEIFIEKPFFQEIYENIFGEKWTQK